MAPAYPLQPMPPLALLLLCLQSADPFPPADHVLLISVDGLRSDALLAAGPEVLPHFFQLMEFPGTLNARTDPAATVTLPNHTGMITGRLMSGPGGHRWKKNGIPEPEETVHSIAGAYLASIFDKPHDNGVFTALLAGKEKFLLFDRSWNKSNGAPDLSGVNHGRDKIDVYLFEKNHELLANKALQCWGSQKRTLVFFHDSAPDLAGHEFGWDLTQGSKYLAALVEVDARLGRFLQAGKTRASLMHRCALVLTADHGGGSPFRGHSLADQWVNATIPLLTWFSGPKNWKDAPAARTALTAGPLRVDLYALLDPSRADPGQSLGLPIWGGKPLRNRDLYFLSQSFLGFGNPALPWSQTSR